jgi:hypothetical protein
VLQKLRKGIDVQIKDVPYENRLKLLPSGFALIWPFRNVPRSDGPYELFLDNNALGRADWLKGLEPEFRDKIVVSPMLALAEQWLSNPHFRSDTEGRIEKFVTPFIEAGVRFPADYAKAQANSLAKSEVAWRAQWMLVYLYVVLLYRITKARKGDTVPDDLLAHLKHQDVPMFNGCIMLCCLASYLRSNQYVRLVGDSKAAYSYLNSFISLHGKAKEENEFDENYVRNRAGDLSIWCAVGALYQNGFHPAGEPVIVTQDNALSKLIFRCLPGYLDPSGRMAFSFDQRAFDSQHGAAITERIRAACGVVPPMTGRDEQLQRMDTLRAYVTRSADTQLATAVDQVWESWLKPGYHESFQ